MNTRSIEVVGTFQGHWVEWVKPLLAGAASAQVHTDTPSPHVLDSLQLQFPDSQVLALIEHPETGLAYSLCRGADLDPEVWLDHWQASARNLVAYARRHPSRALLIYADEARLRPQRFAQLLHSRWAVSLAAPSRLSEHASTPDPLARALARSFLERDLSAHELLPELLGSCATLPGVGSNRCQLLPEVAIDGPEAARRLSDLLKTEKELDRATAARASEQAALRMELRSALEERTRLTNTVQQLEAAHSALMERTDAAERGLRDVQSRLATANQVRDVLESQIASAAARHASLVRELASARERIALITRELGTNQTALEQANERCSLLEQDLAGAREQRRTLEKDLSNVRQAADAAQEETALVVRQLHQVQEELEHTHISKRSAEAELLELKSNLSRAADQSKALEQQLVQAQKQRTSIEQSLAQATNQVSSLRQELLKTTEQRDRLKGQLAQTEKQRLALEHELGQTTQQRSALQERGAQMAQQLESFKHQLSQAASELNNLERQLESSKEGGRAISEERDLLLQQLHQVQEELEKTFLEKRKAENALLAAESRESLKDLEQSLRTAREDCELLTLQGEQMQREIERLQREKIELASQVKAYAAPPWLGDITIGDVAVTGERDTPPHREVSFVARDIRAGTRHIPQATMRLVEHWGRPGLAIFADPQHANLFETWRESGCEDGRPYMLLVHGEESAQGVYSAMGTMDWQLVQALAIRIEQTLNDQRDSCSPYWRSLAQRLQASLREEPARLRYDNVATTSIERQPDGVPHLSLVLENVSYHGRSWRRLPIAWQPCAPTPWLALGSDDESGPALLAWPTAADGSPVPMLRLPLGEAAPLPDEPSVWDTLSGTDRAFIAQLLDLMPILAVHLQASAAKNPGGFPQIDLQAAAASTVISGRASLQPRAPSRPRAQSRRPILLRLAKRLSANGGPSESMVQAGEVAGER